MEHGEPQVQAIDIQLYREPTPCAFTNDDTCGHAQHELTVLHAQRETECPPKPAASFNAREDQ
ncbi:hypothetical protein HaloA020_01550 [Halomonas sp. A020]|nr:hypothetical protein HaloA020_01550 [Halomonas sp. A020]